MGATIRELLIGGRTIEQPTLIRFYVLHILVLPGCAGRALRATTCGASARTAGWRAPTARRCCQKRARSRPRASKTYTLLGVARGHGAGHPRPRRWRRPTATVNAVPDLTRRAATAILGTIAVISILSTLVRSPLEEAANALVTPNPAKAPWYFLWLQEIVTDTTFHVGSFTVNGAFLGGVLLPGLLVGLLAAWPWLDKSPALSRGRVVRQDARGRRTSSSWLICLVVVLFTLVGTFCRGPYWHFYWPWQAWPEIPDEDLRWKSGPIRPTRAATGPVLAVIGVLLVVSTVLFARNDREHEWRYYQGSSSARWPRSSARTRRRPCPLGSSRSGSRALGRADRCVTCHQATGWKGFETADEPFRTHPSEPLENHPSQQFGCTACHGGQGWAVDAEPAHGAVEHWEEPLLGQATGRGLLASSTTRAP